MDQVKRLHKAGAPIPDAITIALKNAGYETLAAFADEYDRNRSALSAAINGTRAPADADLKALIDALGGDAQEWRELLHEAGRPTPTAA